MESRMVKEVGAGIIQSFTKNKWFQKFGDALCGVPIFRIVSCLGFVWKTTRWLKVWATAL